MKKVNRILTPVLAACVYPILYFLPILNVFISSGVMKGEDGAKINLLPKYLELRQYMSISFLRGFLADEDHNKLFTTIMDAVRNGGTSDVAEMIPSIRWLYAALAFFALLLIVVLVFIVFAAIGRFAKTTVFLGIGSAACALMMNVCFNAFAKPFVEGRINVSSILSSATLSEETSSALGMLGSLSSLINRIASVDILQLSSAYTFTFFILVIAVFFCVAAAVTKD